MMSKTRFAIGALALSASGLIGILGYEGYSETAYIPVPGDKVTVGFGHTGTRVDIGENISFSDAVKWLKDDTSTAEYYVKKCVKVPLYQHEYDAFVSFTFNVGGKRFCESTLLKKLNNKDYKGACAELSRWVYSGGKKYKGLEIRREKERLLCETGEYQ